MFRRIGSTPSRRSTLFYSRPFVQELMARFFHTLSSGQTGGGPYNFRPPRPKLEKRRPVAGSRPTRPQKEGKRAARARPSRFQAVLGVTCTSQNCPNCPKMAPGRPGPVNRPPAQSKFAHDRRRAGPSHPSWGKVVSGGRLFDNGPAKTVPKRPNFSNIADERPGVVQGYPQNATAAGRPTRQENNRSGRRAAPLWLQRPTPASTLPKGRHTWPNTAHIGQTLPPNAPATGNAPLKSSRIYP